MSANIQDGGGAETLSRKRTLQDFLSTGKQAKLPNKPATPSKLRLVTDADEMVIDTKENNAVHATDSHPDSPPDSPLSDISDMSDSPLSLMTDSGSNNNSNNMPATPSKSASNAGSPQLVITIDSTPPPDAKILSTTSSSSSSTTGQPPAKRKKLTPVEREEKAKADLARKEEKEKAEAAKKLEKEKAEAARKAEKEKKEKAEAAKKQERDEQKALAEAKKKALAEEKEKKRKQKEEEDQRKAEEKEKKRKEKEDEERKIQEAKNKKERSQLRLNSFFTKGNTSSTSPSASSTSTTPSTSISAATSTSASGLLLTSPHKNASPSPSKASTSSPRKGASAAADDADSSAVSTAAAPPLVEISEYNRIFKPFFIKENVIMATHLYGMDEETREAKSRILDEHLSGARGDFAPRTPFSSASAVDYFHLPCDKQQRPLPRGQAAATRPSVRKIMNAMHDSGYGAGSGNAQTKMALDLLKKVPMKYLFFREDVRPAYFGTVTSQPPQARLSRLARNPLLKTVLPLSYDYDSEAEWVDDGDGEDVDDLDDDEEDLADDDGEMSDFLDDSEEGGMPLRPAFSGGMEPDSTGICWENLNSSNSRPESLPRPELDQYRMEFMIDHTGPIDPFSTKYWVAPEPVEPIEVKAKPAKTKATKAKAVSAAAATTAATPQPAATPSDAFAALSGSTTTTTTAPTAATTASSATTPAAATDPKKAGVAAEFVPDLKKGILQYAKMTKVGIVEILSVEFVGKCTKAQIKNSIDALAERTGTGMNKTWKLKA